MASKTISWSTFVVEEYRITIDEKDLPADPGEMDSFLAGHEAPERRRGSWVDDRQYDILEG